MSPSITKHPNIPFLADLNEDDFYDFWASLKKIANDAQELHLNTLAFAQRVEDHFTEWRQKAERQTLQDATAQHLRSSEPVRRHHYQYSHQRMDAELGRWVNYCGKCDQPKDAAIHFTAPGIEISRPDAQFRQTERVTLADGTEWLIQGVGAEEYVMRRTLHLEGETWHSYVWGRQLLEDAVRQAQEAV